ncbi:alpha/beta fold hydrolase [Streptomyces sp. NPDC101166]|uniref:alpha/beta fold hydrolase n=1 Tax=Streptomyces sp. NPDC101166 TaxID=3366120 RepID=UPI003803C2ED
MSKTRDTEASMSISRPTAFLAELGRRGRHVVAPWLRGCAPPPTAGPFGFAPLTSDVLALRAMRRLSQPIAVPLLQLYGADGGCFLSPQVDDRHRFAAPHALEVVPDVGHFLHIEAPEAIAERITAWAEYGITRPSRRDAVFCCSPRRGLR